MTTKDNREEIVKECAVLDRLEHNAIVERYRRALDVVMAEADRLEQARPERSLYKEAHGCKYWIRPPYEELTVRDGHWGYVTRGWSAEYETIQDGKIWFGSSGHMETEEEAKECLDRQIKVEGKMKYVNN